VSSPVSPADDASLSLSEPCGALLEYRPPTADDNDSDGAHEGEEKDVGGSTHEEVSWTRSGRHGCEHALRARQARGARAPRGSGAEGDGGRGVAAAPLGPHAPPLPEWFSLVLPR
jgi:hypothetical protein